MVANQVYSGRPTFRLWYYDIKTSFIRILHSNALLVVDKTSKLRVSFSVMALADEPVLRLATCDLRL